MLITLILTHLETVYYRTLHQLLWIFVGVILHLFEFLYSPLTVSSVCKDGPG